MRLLTLKSPIMKSRYFVLTLVSLLLTMPLYAQKLSLGYLHPAGGKVGTTVEIEAGGLNINKSTKVFFSHSGIRGELIPFVEDAAAVKKRKKLTDQSSPQLADRVKIRITIAEDVPCGVYDLRLQGAQGVSNKLPFEVSSYRNYIESGKSSRKNPDPVAALPAVLCGQVTPGGIDYYSFSGREGETIVASVKGRQLVPYIADAVPGWFQPVVKIVDAKGKEVAYSDDYRHNVDPLIITTLPKSGTYTLMIHDAIYRGRQDFNYRITLGVVPYVTGRYPAYGVVGKKLKQQIEGVNIGFEKQTIKPHKEGYSQLTLSTAVGTSNGVQFYGVPRGKTFLSSPEQGALLTKTTVIADSLTAKEKIKRYKVDVRFGEPLIVELIGRRNGSRVDAVMRLRDKMGRIVAEADDTEDPLQGLMTFHADPVLKYTPRMNEELTLEVEDLHRGYGRDYHYLLMRHRQLPSFNAFVSPANITIPKGGTASFRVDVTGKVKRPANIEIVGLPSGFKTSNLRHYGKTWEFSITAPKSAEVKRFPIEVKFEYQGDGVREKMDVLPVDNMMQAFYYTHHIQAAELSLEVAEASPYRLSLDFDVEQPILISPNDEEVAVKVLIDRNPGFDEPVDLILGKKRSFFTLEPISIAPDESEKVIYIKLNKEYIQGMIRKKNYPVWQTNIVGTVKGQIERSGKRTFQNAKYSEMTPIFQLKLQKR